MSFYSSVLRRRLLTTAKLGADFSIVYNGAEYKPGDTVTITASTTLTVKGNGKAKVTVIGAGGGGAGAVDSSLDYQGGNGGNGLWREQFAPALDTYGTPKCRKALRSDVSPRLDLRKGCL